MAGAPAPASRRAAWRRWRVGLAAALLIGLVCGLAAAQSIGFTVQVIAVSDQANALDISRRLLREGFPAYVVRSTGSQGDVYRVRVGSFANRAAAARYATAMPDVGGARPVPALAEAIPAGIMPLAPRVLWHEPIATRDLHILPWPGGIALRRQALEPMRQATYVLVQEAEVRTVEAWRLAALSALPPSPTVDVIDVPFVDLVDPRPGTDAGDAPVGDDAEEAAAGEVDPAEGDAVEASAAPAPALADTGPEAEPEEGLLLLRDRSLWPASGTDDAEEVRVAYRAATVALVAGRLAVDAAVVEATSYEPGGAPPPALVVVEVSDRSGRDLGDVRGLADPGRGLRPDGPLPAEGIDLTWWPPFRIGVRVNVGVAADGPVGGPAWTLAGDDGFVRITTADGASWRAVAGTPLWSDGRHALVRDGDDLVLIDFTTR